MRPPIDTGMIHFVGIGGIGMSGIAEILLNLGYQVQGSDAAESANVKRLRDLGASVFIGHDAANLGQARVVVVSSAIKRDNPELAGAREKRLPVVRRADMLAQLMRFKSCIAVAGTHGKTTTTSIVAALLDAGGMDPTVVNGGIINALGTNARLGKGDWMVVEADESDGTFVRLPAEVGIITNIDPEHLDHYGSFDAARAAFKLFVENLPFYGFAVLCIDHPEVQALIGRIEDRTVITYGENPQADMRLVDVRPGPEGTRFAVVHRARLTGAETRLDDLMLPMPGRHNVLNAVAALTVAYRLGVPVDKIRQGLKNFAGVKRRFTLTGTWNGVRVYDDYGHHPVEIAAALRAARDASRGRVIAVMQPHRYTRLRDLFNEFCSCFNDADTVIVADVYAAGEAPIAGIDADALAAGVQGRGHRDVKRLGRPEGLAGLVAGIARPEDLVICLGAGSVSQWAYALPAQLESVRPSASQKAEG